MTLALIPGLIALLVLGFFSFALSRLFSRTGHGIGWTVACYSPIPLLVLIIPLSAYMVSVGSVVTGILSLFSTLVVLIYPVLLGIVAFKAWPMQMLPAPAPEIFE